MILTIFVAFFTLIFLIVLHELGHFVLAKKFGVKVEEFGVGLPPRIFGKKFGETLYSLNWLPIGAFVRLYGEEKQEPGAESFSGKPIWQRALIVGGGVISFWIIAVLVLTIMMGLGVPTPVSDTAGDDSLKNPQVQIIAIAPDSPAAAAGLKMGDAIKKLRWGGDTIKINRVSEVQEFMEGHRGEKVVIEFARGGQVRETEVVPRFIPPEGEGPLGVALSRVALKTYPWWEAPWRGIYATGMLTLNVILGWVYVFSNLFQGQPTGADVMGPVGIVTVFAQITQMGLVYFLQFVATISVYLALFNVLPIPAVDGGKLFFLALEAARKKPLPEKLEQSMTAAFFFLIIGLMLFVTFRDITRLL